MARGSFSLCGAANSKGADIGGCRLTAPKVGRPARLHGAGFLGEAPAISASMILPKAESGCTPTSMEPFM